MRTPRDLEDGFGEVPGHAPGRKVIAVIGIDRYRHWKPLSNAVRDAHGAAAVFARLGFEQVATALIDDHATGPEIQSLVTDELTTLGPDDSLVIFYAGHGSTRTHRLGDRVIKTGYLMPVDAQAKVATWIDLQGWLRAVSVLSPRHILVILDACQSGIALDPVFAWRAPAPHDDEPLATLQSRRSRRIITSALGDQVAHDGGPIHGHSLFTGCLIEALTHGTGRTGRRYVTSSELGLHLQERVGAYPDSRQTPDFGAFTLDERGEMAIPLLPALADITASRSAMTVGSPCRPWYRSTIAPIATVLGGAAVLSSIRWFVPTPTRPAGASAPASPASPVARPGTDEPKPPASREPPKIDPPPAHEPRCEPSVHALLEPCPSDMVPIPGETFLMGSKENEGLEDEHPMHAVTLSPYCMDRTEVTVKAYAACVGAGRCVPPQLTVQWSGALPSEVALWSQFCNNPNDRDRSEHPINCIDWNEASAYCASIGRRLPSEAEWEHAARGTDQRTWPWGSAIPDENRLNACGAECYEWAMNTLRRKWRPMYGGSDGWLSTAPVGSFPAGESPFCVRDMAGNVFEWTADWYGRYRREAVSDPPGPETGTERVIRGGGWLYYDPSHVTTTFRYQNDPLDRCHNVGFRCALDDRPLRRGVPPL